MRSGRGSPVNRLFSRPSLCPNGRRETLFHRLVAIAICARSRSKMLVGRDPFSTKSSRAIDTLLLIRSLFPKRLKYEFPDRLSGRILAPEDWFDIPVPLHGERSLSTEDVACIRSAIPIVWGRVVYRDGHGDSHETASGYVYHLPQGGMINFEARGFRVAGPPITTALPSRTTARIQIRTLP